MGLQDQVADLEARVAATTAAWQEARDAADRARREGSVGDVIAPYADYLKDKEYGRNGETRGEPDPNVMASLTADMLEAIQSEGLHLVPRNVEVPAAGLVVVDPRPAEALRSAEVARDAARRDLAAFDREHGDELARQRNAAEAERIRSALAGDDPAAIREAIGV
jgi:hypothetical protein